MTAFGSHLRMTTLCALVLASGYGIEASAQGRGAAPPPGLTPPPAVPAESVAPETTDGGLDTSSNVTGYSAGGSEADDIIAQTGTVLSLPGSQSGSRPNTYSVVRGDTMWDICARFWGDPYFWPSLWSYNPSVGNAHFIYPADLLRFTQGSPVRPPGMAVGDEPSPQDEEFSELLEATPLTSQYVESGLSNAIECGAPLPFNPEEAGAELVSNQLGFLDTTNKAAVGQILKSPEMGYNLGEKDLVYLEFAQLSEVSCGDVYTVYRPLEKKVKHPSSRFQRLGDLYSIAGEVRVLDINDHYATAEILRAYVEVLRGDLLSEFVPIRKQVDVRASTKDIDGSIVVGLVGDERSLSERDIVFIDRGEDDGLAEGDAFYIMRSEDGHHGPSRKDDMLPNTVVGQLVVLEASESHSSAVIVKSTDVINIGDQISMTLY